MIPSGFGCVQYDLENKSEVDTGRCVWFFSVFTAFFFSDIKPILGHCTRKKNSYVEKIVLLKKTPNKRNNNNNVPKLSHNLSLKNICLKFHATKIHFPPICYGFKNEAFGT